MCVCERTSRRCVEGTRRDGLYKFVVATYFAYVCECKLKPLIVTEYNSRAEVFVSQRSCMCLCVCVQAFGAKVFFFDKMCVVCACVCVVRGLRAKCAVVNDVYSCSCSIKLMNLSPRAVMFAIAIICSGCVCMCGCFGVCVCANR